MMKKRAAASILIMAMLVSQFSFASGKESLKKDTGKSKESTAVSQEQIQAERELEDEKQALLREEEGYNSQYLVWHGTEQPDVEALENYARQSFAKAKSQKAKKIQAVEGKIKDAREKKEFAAQLERNGAKLESREIAQAEIDDHMLEGYDRIRLPESVDPVLFMEGFQKAAGDSVSIQPDYIMELAAEADADAKVEFRQEADEKQEELENEELAGEAAAGTEETEEEISDLPEAILDRDADLQEAWKRSKGTGVTIALIDTGVDTAHPDLEGHVLEGYDFVNDRKGVYDAELGMEQAHGTHVAGIIAGAAPEADILPLKVFENGRAYTSDILEAIVFAKEQGAAVVNMSFGSTDNNQALRQAMEESGMFFVCAAGNHRRDLGETPIYPAAFGLENSISVAALNQDLGLSYFSNYGESVDIAAWGRDVDSCFPEGEHGLLDGTSMAAGYVSAAAALAFQEFEEGGLKERLKSTSDRITCLDGKIAQGNKLSFFGAVYGAAEKEVVTVTPEEEFDGEYEIMSPEEKWQLFSSKNNAAISAGSRQALVLKEDGTIWTWGYNDSGLGNDEKAKQSYAPVKVMINDVSEISAGYEYNIALKKDGTLYAWGYNADGQFGNGTISNSSLPTRVAIASRYGKIKAISAGVKHTLAITENGKVLSWGSNSFGELGDGTTDSRITPVEVVGLSNIVEVSAGLYCSMALDSDGKVWVWGKEIPGYVYHKNACPYPEMVNCDAGIIKKISSGNGYNRAMLSKHSGSIWGWGRGYFGNGLLGDTIFQQPTLISGGSTIDLGSMIQISIGSENTLALRQNGTVCGWGANRNGELGIGATTEKTMAVQVASDIQAVAVGRDFSIMLKNDGAIVASGNNASGQCGQNKSVTRCLYPTEVQFNENLSFDAADRIEVDQTVYDKLVNKSEYRYYAFTPSLTDTYVFEAVSDIDTYGEMYNSNRERIQYNDDGRGAGRSTNGRDFYMEQELTGGETYYLVVSSYHGNYVGEYEVDINYKDDYGNKIENAKKIDEGNTSGRIERRSDIDMFQFIPANTGFYEIQSISEADLSGNLYDSSGKEIAQSSSKSSGVGESKNRQDFYMNHKLDAGEVYYISVQSEREVPKEIYDEYNLKISCKDDYGNDTDQASDIKVGDVINCKIDYAGDVDMFRFTPSKTANYIFESISQFDTYGTIYTASKTRVTYNDDGGCKGESTNRQDFYIKYPLTANTTYYIAVKAYSSNKTGSLTLKVKESKDDYGDTDVSAYDISKNYMTEGEINFIGDTDVFKFTPNTSETYILSVVGNTRLNGTMQIYNGNTNKGTISPVFEGNNMKFKTRLNAGEKIYLKVFNKDSSVSSIGTYQIYIETPLTVEIK